MSNQFTTSPAATVNTPTATPDPDDGGALIRSFLAELTSLTEAQRSAFTRQCSAEKVDDWGKRTKAVNVLHDAERFARVIRDALRRRDGAPVPPSARHGAPRVSTQPLGRGRYRSR